MKKAVGRSSAFADLLKKAGGKEKNATPPKKGDPPAFIQTLTSVVSVCYYLLLLLRPTPVLLFIN